MLNLISITLEILEINEHKGLHRDVYIKKIKQNFLNLNLYI